MKKLAIIVAAISLITSCNTQNKESKQAPAIGGDSIAKVSQAVLVSKLTKAISDSGTVGAVAFCNLNASGLLDSLSKAYNCTITRISDKYRNPSNKPTDEEIAILNKFKAAYESNKSLAGELVKGEGGSVHYKPIAVGMPTCLGCHGSATDIDSATASKIKNLYPGDLATGYKMGDFRGAWKIVMKQ